MGLVAAAPERAFCSRKKDFTSPSLLIAIAGGAISLGLMCLTGKDWEEMLEGEDWGLEMLVVRCGGGATHGGAGGGLARQSCSLAAESRGSQEGARPPGPDLVVQR